MPKCNMAQRVAAHFVKQYPCLLNMEYTGLLNLNITSNLTFSTTPDLLNKCLITSHEEKTTCIH